MLDNKSINVAYDFVRGEGDEVVGMKLTGLGVDNILEAIINKIPCPKGSETEPLEAMIFDSVFNSFRGIIAYFRVFNCILLMASKYMYNVVECG